MKRILLSVMLFICCNWFLCAQEKSIMNIDDLLNRLENIGPVPGAISEYFTSEELDLLKKHFNEKKGIVAEKPTSDLRSMIATEAYTTNNSEFGSFEPPNGEVTVINNNTSIINAGVINPNDPTKALVLDNVGDFYSIDLATGVYTSLGSIPGAWLGAEIHPVTGIMYAIDDTNLYSIDTVNVTASLIGPIGLGGIPIALAIDGSGNAYTYDVLDDHLYSIDLNTGLATDIGHIGFDSNFAQGMFWHTETDTIYMTAFNNTLFEAQLRSVNIVTGETIYLGLLGDFASLSQFGWASSETIASPGPDPQIFITWHLNFLQSTDLNDPFNIEDIEPIINPNITILDDLSFTGEGACNTFNGTFNFEEPNNLDAFGSFISTDLDCGFQIHNSFENNFFDFLNNPLWYELSDGGSTLNLYNGLFGIATFQDEPLSVSDFDKNSIKVYPNPASEKLFISSEKYDIDTVAIYSTQGRKIIAIENIKASIDVSQLAKGIYFLEVLTSKGRSTQKFIKK